MKVSLFLVLVLIEYVQVSPAGLLIPQVTGNSNEQCNLELASIQASTSAIYDAVTNIVNRELNKIGRAVKVQKCLAFVQYKQISPIFNRVTPDTVSLALLAGQLLFN